MELLTYQQSFCQILQRMGWNSEHTDHMTQVIHPKGEIGKEENESID